MCTLKAVFLWGDSAHLLGLFYIVNKASNGGSLRLTRCVRRAYCLTTSIYVAIVGYSFNTNLVPKLQCNLKLNL
jgi:hypothetical protein